MLPIVVASDEKIKELEFNKNMLPKSNGMMDQILHAANPIKMLVGGAKQIAFKITGNATIDSISPSRARELYHFPIGHPQDGYVYVQHPIYPKKAILVSDFNEVIAQEKMAAFFKLSSTLGAKSISLTGVEVNKQLSDLFLGVPIPKYAGKLGLSATFSEDGLTGRALQAEWGKAWRGPRVPNELKPWLDFDPVLRVLAENRINESLARANVSIQTNKIIDTRSGIFATISDYGLSLGGNYKQASDSAWSFEVEFWEISWFNRLLSF